MEIILNDKPLIKVYNSDCMEILKNTPDKFYDLAVVDPPYGGANNKEWESKPTSRFGGWFTKYKIERTGGSWSENTKKIIKHWDIAPNYEYFEELFRVSKDQIIWGGNYFALPANRCFLIWEKLTIHENFSMAMAEYAWCSFNKNAKIFKYPPQDPNRFHPTQKPRALYHWIYKKYAKAGYKILDTHLGSGSSAIEAYYSKLDFTGIELDSHYFNSFLNRYKKETSQLSFL